MDLQRYDVIKAKIKYQDVHEFMVHNINFPLILRE